MKYIDELSCHEAIKSIRPDAYNIVTPKVLGGVNTVFISDTVNGKFVFRFSSEEAAKRNEIVSSILIDHEIPVPSITACQFDGVHFETYPYLPGKTLFERVKEGMDEYKIEQVYVDWLKTMQKISNIDTSLFADLPAIRTEPIQLKERIKRPFIHLLNLGRKKVYQADIYSKNVLVDNNDNFSYMLDLDSIALNYETSALARIAYDSKELGYDSNKIYKIYTNLHENMLTKLRIKYQVMMHSNYRNIMNFIRGERQ